MVKLLFLKAVSQSPFLSSVPKYFDKTQRNAQNGKAGVLACSYSDLTEATLVGRGLKKRSLSFQEALVGSVNTRNRMETCNL